jgi:hypothetical protein
MGLVRRFVTCLAVASIPYVAGCGDLVPPTPRTGITGAVHLWPVCPVERAGMPCVNQAAGHVPVTIHEGTPQGGVARGRVVATGRTDADGTFRVPVVPGDYVVTADAGRSCDLIAVHVGGAAYAAVEISCSTGIR